MFLPFKFHFNFLFKVVFCFFGSLFDLASTFVDYPFVVLHDFRPVRLDQILQNYFDAIFRELMKFFKCVINNLGRLLIFVKLGCNGKYFSRLHTNNPLPKRILSIYYSNMNCPQKVY